MKNKRNTIAKSRVIVDSRDGSKDKFIPTSVARKLYDEGKLAVDVTNSINERVYCPNGDETWRKHI